MDIAIISVTEQGDSIAKKISLNIKSFIYFKKDVKKLKLSNITKEVFEKYRKIIFIASTGIAVRAIAPYIKSKDKDPAVIVIDSTGRFVISLLSGHLGGANEFTEKVAHLISAQPIITTATDNLGITAPDVIAKNNNLVIENLKCAKDISSRLVHGEKIIFIDDKNLIKNPKGYVSNKEQLENITGSVYVTNKIKYLKNHQVPSLKLIRRDIVLGIGCRKNYDSEKMKGTVLKFLQENNIDYRSVKVVSTVEIKKNEKAIINLAQFLNADLKIFLVEEIRKIQHKYVGSNFVEKAIGIRAVCEPCVELSKAKIIVEKQKCEGMTISIGIL
ncbi:cobalt-precorrin 5A hydrolase [Haloimpatiens sp. FM7330]|uniref:cobalt-precorrin 5A hydrolase n=1 Tax=Haloimpatiens sp. FM7330 TaxID=3298610 RepID=UPI003627ED19